MVFSFLLGQWGNTEVHFEADFYSTIATPTYTGSTVTQEITPSTVRYIKLGENGIWGKSCIEEGTVRLGYNSPHHQDSLAGRWEPVFDYWFNFRTGDHRTRTAKRDIKQVRDFYELDQNTLWFTFYNRKLWWCFAQPEVIELEDSSRKLGQRRAA